MSDQVINPFEDSKKINSIDPFSKTPEQEKQFKNLEKQFKEKYNTNLEKLFWNIFPKTIWKINWNYQLNWWNFDIALSSEIKKFFLEYKDKKNLEWLIKFYIQKNKIWNIQEQKETSEIEIFSLKKEHPFVPILERYLEIWILTKKEFNNIINELDTERSKNLTSNINAKTAISNSNLSLNKKDQLLKVNDFLIQKEYDNEQKIIKWEKIKIPSSFLDYESLQNKNDDIIQLIAIHYISIPNWKWEINTKKDISTAIKKSTNDIIYWKKFDRDKMIFKTNLQIIRWEYSIKEKIQALRKIQNYINNNQWKKWWALKKQNLYFENVDQLKELSLEEMQEKIQELLIKAKENNKKNISEITGNSTTIKKEKNWWWEIFKWGKEDTIKNLSNTTKND